MLASPDHDIAVVYLLRKGNRAAYFRAFLASLARYPAGMPYLPVLLQKGFAPGEIHPRARDWRVDGVSAQVVPVSDDGLALTAYRTGAAQIAARRILFLNSYSQMLAPDWLSKIARAAEQLGPGGVVGATGSWEALDERAPFPNVCLRTNAFLIDRQRFLAFPHRLDTRRESNDFEAGPGNMSATILAQGDRLGVVDCDGRLFTPEEWPDSLTSRSGNQERLLVADNRTVEYQIAGLRRRRRRAELAFGQRARLVSQSPWQRLRVAIAWRIGLPLPRFQK